MSAAEQSNVVAMFKPQAQRESEKKWGKAVMSHGCAIFPSILLRAQARLGVNAQEMMVLLHLAEHWWAADSRVFPAKKVIAERIGLSTKQVQRHVKRLEELKLVERKQRFSRGLQTSNEYDLSGLVVKLQVIEKDFETARKVKKAAADAGGLTQVLKKQ
jgi:predicted transcriptional regulator